MRTVEGTTTMHDAETNEHAAEQVTEMLYSFDLPCFCRHTTEYDQPNILEVTE